MLRKFASLEASQILDIKGTGSRSRTASLNTISNFNDYRTEDGYLYARIRAISSRTNKNHDGWPSIELAGSNEIFDRHQAAEGSGFTVEAGDGSKDYGYATFVGKPIFVDHHNSNPERARGVIVDAKFHVEDHKTAAELDPYYATAPDSHMPPAWVELLLEVDAKGFPKLAKAIIEGSKDGKTGIDGFSMGCFVAGTPITLADGTQKPIEAIEVDDEVLTHTGKVEPVTFVMNRPHKGIVYDVKTYGQSVPMLLTAEHPVWTKTGWVEARDLTTDDFVLSPTLMGMGHPGAYPFARLLGYYLAEGNLCFDRKRFVDGRPVSVEWSFHTNEVEYIEEVKTLLEAIGYRATGPYIKTNCASIRCNSPELAQRFLEYGGQHSWNKKLHTEVMSWDPESQRGLLRAYFNGDGCYRNDGKRVEAGTASQKLAQQLQLIATRVGIKMTPPVRQHSPSAVLAGKRPKYSMQATLEPSEKIHYGAHLDEQGLWRRISSIGVKEYEGNVYNFDVEGDDSYVAADIAVHNCDVDRSVCNICRKEASAPDEYCEHIRNKGAEFNYVDDTGKRTSKKSYEDCYGIKFFEISAVFDPADETALVQEVRHESSTKTADVTENQLPQSELNKAPADVDTLRQEKICPICGSTIDNTDCSVCGYTTPPEGFGNPDLTKAQDQESPDPDAAMVPQPEQEPVAPEPVETRKELPTPGLTSSMTWTPKINSRVANRGGGDQPDETVIKDETTPTTSRTAQSLIASADRTNRTNQEATMEKNSEAAAGAPEAASPDKRVDVEGVGGIMDAPKADAQVDVEGKGGTGVEDVSADKTESITDTSDDAGFQDGGSKGNNSGPTKTWADKGQQSPVTDKVFQAAKKGVEPLDASGKPDARVDLEQEVPVSYGESATGTHQWTGTDGNGVTRQHNPVTKVPGITSHVVNIFKLADTEVEMGLIPSDKKYERIAELETATPEVVQELMSYASKVKTAGLSKTKTASAAHRVPSFSRMAKTEEPTPQAIDDTFLDSAFFS